VKTVIELVEKALKDEATSVLIYKRLAKLYKGEAIKIDL